MNSAEENTVCIFYMKNQQSKNYTNMMNPTGPEAEKLSLVLHGAAETHVSVSRAAGVSLEV